MWSWDVQVLRHLDTIFYIYRKKSKQISTSWYSQPCQKNRDCDTALRKKLRLQVINNRWQNKTLRPVKFNKNFARPMVFEGQFTTSTIITYQPKYKMMSKLTLFCSLSPQVLLFTSVWIPIQFCASKNVKNVLVAMSLQSKSKGRKYLTLQVTICHRKNGFCAEVDLFPSASLLS